MANKGFSAATDLFGMGDAWGVRSADLNKSGSVAECKNALGDVTHRDTYAERIAPSAEYVLLADVTALPALGGIVMVDGKSVMVTSIAITTAAGAAPTASVSGVQVQDGATAVRTYSCGTLALSKRHRAQDILGWLGDSAPETLTNATFTFSVESSLADPKGVVAASDCAGGKVEATFTFACGDGTAIVAPEISDAKKVVSAPVSKSSPENDYVTCTFSVTDTLTGTEAS